MNPITEEHHLDPKPPRLEEERQQLEAALAMKTLADGIKVPPRPEISMDNEPKAVSDRAQESRAAAILTGTSNDGALAVLRAIGIDPDQLRQDVSRQSELLGAYHDVKVVRRGARDGRRICDRFRQITAAMVDTEAAALLEATSDDQRKSALISDLRDIHNAKMDRLKDQQGAQQRLAKIEQAARDRVKDVEARKRLHTLMSAMRQGQALPWDQVMEAVETYTTLFGDDLDDDLPPQPAPQAADRRDRSRLH
jgi:hypothetical protein